MTRFGLVGGGAGVVVLFAGDVFSGDRDAQLAEEAEIVLGEGLVDVAAGGDFDVFVLFGGEIVEGDGGFEHEQHIKAVTTDILNDAGDVLVLGDRLIDGLSQLLNEFAQTCCHRCLQGRGPQGGCEGCGKRFIYHTSDAARDQVGMCESRPKSGGNTSAATIITE